MREKEGETDRVEKKRLGKVHVKRKKYNNYYCSLFSIRTLVDSLSIQETSFRANLEEFL